MHVVALAGGVGAGKFLRGLVRVVDPSDVAVVGNTGDDLMLHGLHISPDLDSVMYWLAGIADRDRGWGRSAESFRTLEELRARGGEAWFTLGDLDLATHLMRTHLLSEGRPLSEATAVVSRAFGVGSALLPMSDDPVTTRIETVDGAGKALDLHFQEWWVARGGTDEVKAIRYDGAGEARPGPAVTDAITAADVVVICPSNPVASIAPILSVPGIADAVRERPVVGITPIVAGAPLRGMADRLMPAAALEVTTLGAARAYRGLLDAWVLDERDSDAGAAVERELGIRVAAVDTIMTDDDRAERVAAAALELVRG